MLKPQLTLTEAEVKKGLRKVIGDGLTTEAMTVLTSGTFLVAMTLLLGGNNLQIGILAAIPTFVNVFQLISIWLVKKYNNRRAVVVICSILARIPLIIIGILPLISPKFASVDLLIFFLFFYYLFGSIAGPGWNSWMKDLVPEDCLGNYFSKRTRYAQILNVSLSIVLAFVVDFIKDKAPGFELQTYAVMFTLAGISGLYGAYLLSQASEPQAQLQTDNLFKLLKKPLKNNNFIRLLIFNSMWVFALNLATPFFTVYLLRGMNYPLSYIIILNVISQLFSIITIRTWGRFADRYSNKTIIAISAPIYILCLIAWCFVGIYTHEAVNIGLLVVIYIFSGIATAGINLSLTNIGLKLAPKEESIIYLSAKNIITAFFSTIAPLIGGYLADFFTTRHLNIKFEWGGPNLSKVFRLVELHDWNFLFLIAALMAFIAVQFLAQVKEKGEVEKEQVKRIMRVSIKGSLKEYSLIGHLVGWHTQLWSVIKRKVGFDGENAQG